VERPIKKWNGGYGQNSYGEIDGKGRPGDSEGGSGNEPFHEESC
jgi:hypothetical protein